MELIHNLNLWLTYRIGSTAVMTPVWAGLSLLALLAFLSIALRDEGFEPFEKLRHRAMFAGIGLMFTLLFALYTTSLRWDERLGVAEKMLFIREHGGVSLYKEGFWGPKMAQLSDSFAWTCSGDRDPWSCVKNRQYLQKKTSLLP